MFADLLSRGKSRRESRHIPRLRDRRTPSAIVRERARLRLLAAPEAGQRERRILTPRGFAVGAKDALQKTLWQKTLWIVK
jgi:hypothetical protein